MNVLFHGIVLLWTNFGMHMLWYLKLHCMGLVLKSKHMANSLMLVAYILNNFTLHITTLIVFYQSRLSKQGIQVKVYFNFIINCLSVDTACNVMGTVIQGESHSCGKTSLESSFGKEENDCSR